MATASSFFQNDPINQTERKRTVFHRCHDFSGDELVLYVPSFMLSHQLKVKKVGVGNTLPCDFIGKREGKVIMAKSHPPQQDSEFVYLCSPR